MNRYCVQCGKQNIAGAAPSFMTRCRPCFIRRGQLLKENRAGGSKDWKFVTVITAGIPVAHREPEPWAAQYCTDCGGPIEMNKIQYAAQRRGEARYCGDCDNERKF